MNKSELKNVPNPICPLNMYFEGDEDKCDTSKCDFSTETRSCTTTCALLIEKIGNSELKISDKKYPHYDNLTVREKIVVEVLLPLKNTSIKDKIFITVKQVLTDMMYLTSKEQEHIEDYFAI